MKHRHKGLRVAELLLEEAIKRGGRPMADGLPKGQIDTSDPQVRADVIATVALEDVRILRARKARRGLPR